MQSSNQLKEVVREKYSLIADQPRSENLSSCCGATSCCSNDLVHVMAEDYNEQKGYVPEADLGLGCGLPTVFADIKNGDTVIDLGSGAGNDCFIARSLVGESGKVIGIDFTEKMIEKARTNAEKLNFNNVEFRFGDIEDMPLVSNKADVVVSNCVLNLVPNKHKVFSEIYRVLKPGAHFSISDIVLTADLPPKWMEVAALYAGCIAGAEKEDGYLAIIRETGFVNVVVQQEKEIILPDEILAQYLDAEEINLYKSTNTPIKSITVYGEKPAKDERKCCDPGSGCC